MWVLRAISAAAALILSVATLAQGAALGQAGESEVAPPQQDDDEANIAAAAALPENPDELFTPAENSAAWQILLTAIRTDPSYCETGAARLLAYMGDPQIARIATSIRLDMYVELFQCTYAAGDWETANTVLSHSLEYVGTENVGGAAHAVQFTMAVLTENPDAAYVALLKTAMTEPQGVNGIPQWAILSYLKLIRGEDDEGALTLQALDVLFTAGYTPSTPLVSPDPLHAMYARRLVAEGRLDDARNALRGTTDLWVLINIAIDGRFRPIRDVALSDDVDFRALAEAQAARARALAIDHPASMEPHRQLIYALRKLGRNDEALAEADATLERHAQNASAFEDADELEQRVRHVRAAALYALGRYDEGRAALQSLVAQTEVGENAQFDVIHLSIKLTEENRPNQALQALALLPQPSSNTAMYAYSVRACAAVQRDDATQLEDALIYLREHESDSVTARQRALLCANKIDQAADLYVRRLRDRHERVDALLALQNWSPVEHELPYEQLLRERVDAIKVRPDVVAAIGDAGHVLDIPLPSISWRNY